MNLRGMYGCLGSMCLPSITHGSTVCLSFNMFLEYIVDFCKMSIYRHHVSVEKRYLTQLFTSQISSLAFAMRHYFPTLLLLLGTLMLPCVAQDTSQPPGLEGIDDPEMTKRLIHYWADYSCYAYNDNSEQPPAAQQCAKACYTDGMTSDVEGEGIHSQTCWLNGPESDARTGNPLTDEEKSQVPRTSMYWPQTFDFIFINTCVRQNDHNWLLQLR
jgi:hypothetical protein